MDSYTQLFSPNYYIQIYFYLSVYFRIASSVYNLYLLNKMFQSQQNSLRKSTTSIPNLSTFINHDFNSHSFRNHTIISTVKNQKH